MPHRKRTTWIATFDGNIARVWLKDPATGYLSELNREGMDGRVERGERDDPGGRGDLRPAGDPQFFSEQTFVERFVRHLERRCAEGAFQCLIVSAAPRALGHFRELAGEQLRSAVIAELDKDHVHTPVKQLEAALKDAVA